ncbi:unnamed protein product, partial [marine sediment metagenome]
MCLAAQGSDNIIRFKTFFLKNGNIQRFQNIFDSRDLLVKFIWRLDPFGKPTKQGSLFEGAKPKKQKLDGKYKIVTSAKDLEKLISVLKKSKGFVIDTETDNLDGELIGISFAIQPKEAFYIPVTSPNTKVSEGLEKDKVIKKLKPLLESMSLNKWGYNLKYDWRILHREGINLSPIEFDCMIASYLTNPATRVHKLDQIAFIELGYEMIPISELLEENQDLSRLDVKKVGEYSCEDADICLRLKKKFEKSLKENNMEELFFKLEMPLVPILAEIEE